MKRFFVCFDEWGLFPAYCFVMAFAWGPRDFFDLLDPFSSNNMASTSLKSKQKKRKWFLLLFIICNGRQIYFCSLNLFFFVLWFDLVSQLCTNIDIEGKVDQLTRLNSRCLMILKGPRARPCFRSRLCSARVSACFTWFRVVLAALGYRLVVTAGSRNILELFGMLNLFNLLCTWMTRAKRYFFPRVTRSACLFNYIFIFPNSSKSHFCTENFLAPNSLLDYYKLEKRFWKTLC